MEQYISSSRLSIHDMFESAYWVLPLLFLTYYATNTVFAKRKQIDHFPVGTPLAIAPKFILNLIFAGWAVDILQKGYKKFQNSAYRLIRNDGNIVILPLPLLEELSALPVTVANPQAALEHDLLGRYTGLNLILENRLHHSIVQRKLTPRLPLLIPRMEKSVTDAFEGAFPQGEEWTEFQPYQVLGGISARVAAEAIVGPMFCNDPVWLGVAFNYTENLFRTVVVLRMLPGWMQPLICPLLPSFWEGQKQLKLAKELLGPRISELSEKNNAGVWEPEDDNADHLNILSWLSATAKGRDRDPDAISHVLVLVALASVHTTLLRMVNVLYDVTAAGPSLQDTLLDEITNVSAAGWNTASYDQLHRLDSVMRESQRISPPTTLGLKRLFREPYTFQDGTHVPAGTYVCMPIHAIENDAAHTARPQEYNGLRMFRARQELERLGSVDKAMAKDLLFTTPTRTALNFGYGKTACPGRFFASVVIKMVLVKMLTEYEFAFLPGTKRPANLMAHEFLFTWPWQKILVRRKKEAAAPF